MTTNVDDKIDREILRFVSMNGRASLEDLGKRVGLQKHAIYRRLKRLENEFGIDYLAEIDTEKLGYLKFLIFFRFLKVAPTNEEITIAIKNEPRVQFAATTTGGNYDLMLYILAESNLEINLIRRNLVRDTCLSNFPAEVYVTPFYEHHGFVPLRMEFIESLVDDLTKKQNKGLIIELEKPTEKRKQILKREYATLKELNNDGSMSFIDIDKKYGFDKGRSQYSYYKLKQNGVIRRITISMTKVQIRYLSFISMKVIHPKRLYKTRYNLLLNIIKETQRPINRYALVGDIEIPFGVMMIMPVFEENDIDKIQNELLKTKGIEIKYGVITRILLGRLCYRLFDSAYSVQQKVLTEQFNFKRVEKLDY